MFSCLGQEIKKYMNVFVKNTNPWKAVAKPKRKPIAC